MVAVRLESLSMDAVCTQFPLAYEPLLSGISRYHFEEAKTFAITLPSVSNSIVSTLAGTLFTVDQPISNSSAPEFPSWNPKLRRAFSCLAAVESESISRWTPWPRQTDQSESRSRTRIF